MKKRRRFPKNPGFVAKIDKRDKEYPLAGYLARERVPTGLRKMFRQVPHIYDQGQTPSCVGHGFALALAMAPKGVMVDPKGLYRAAKRVDGNNNPGTSLHSALSVLTQHGQITGYSWAKTISEIARYLVHVGPVVVGTVWTEAMNFPDHNQYMQVDDYDTPMGHCYTLVGVDIENERFQIANSYGEGWGYRGRARIKFNEFQRLLDRGGQAVAIHKP